MRTLRTALIHFSPFLFLPALLAQIQLNQTPTRAIGQTDLVGSSINLVEGREFSSPQGIALDTTLSPPALYVSDTGNSRVLGFRNALSFVNGQKADIVIGQPSFTTTAPLGPGSTRSTGFSFPVGVAVDRRGSLYVVDAGNNRILRFPAPFSQTDQFPDLVIGQTNFNARTPNPNGLSASTLSLTTNVGVAQAYITFDSAGNLWAADPGNNRVLRYPAAAVGPNATNAPLADVVLGQVDFGSNNTPSLSGTIDATALSSLSLLYSPTGVTFDGAGNLFVSESNSSIRGRILVYSPPFSNGKQATRILGVVLPTTQPQPPFTSEQQFYPNSGAIFTLNGGVAIADTQANRILAFRPVPQFTGNNLTQQAQSVIGQTDFSGNLANQGLPEAGPDRLTTPTSAVATANELFITDTGNNRVLVLPYSGTNFGPATRVLGQVQLNLSAPNLVEGRELRMLCSAPSRDCPAPVFPNGTQADSGVVTDLSSDPPRLYIADTYNNRILGFADARKVKQGDYADLVIGQPDLQRTIVNYPSGDPNKPTATGLFAPTGLTVDSSGNLYVADSGNGRVLRFPSPFAHAGAEIPDLVLGQRGFNAPRIGDASAATMSFPYGIALVGNNGLAVSDTRLNRVLFFAGAPSSLTSGMAASKVFGQADFVSSAAGGDNRLSSPRHIATDSDDRLYVSDFGNNRVVIFDRTTTAGPDPRPGTILSGLSGPRGILVSQSTGEIWVTDTGNNQVLRYPKFNDLPLVANQSNYRIPSPAPLAIALDRFGNLYTADASNRVTVNYPGFSPVNAANFVAGRALAPGTIGTIFGVFENQFGTATQAFSSLPLPTQLAGVQVLLNDQPVPLLYVSPKQINFVVPIGAPSFGQSDLQVFQPATSRTLGDFPLQMDVASPALFTFGNGGTGQVAAINAEDNSINGKDHPATVGSVVSFYGTGQGVVPNAPPDGTAPSTAVPTPLKPIVIIGTKPVSDDAIQYSGLAPGLVGVWQVNVKIPDDVAPTSAVPNTPVVFVLNTISSNGVPFVRLNTTMWVKAKP